MLICDLCDIFPCVLHCIRRFFFLWGEGKRQVLRVVKLWENAGSYNAYVSFSEKISKHSYSYKQIKRSLKFTIHNCRYKHVHFMDDYCLNLKWVVPKYKGCENCSVYSLCLPPELCSESFSEYNDLSWHSSLIYYYKTTPRSGDHPK